MSSLIIIIFFKIVWLIQDSERFVTREEGEVLAKELGCLFFECSATTQKNVHQCFEELALKVKTLISIYWQNGLF